MEDLFTEPANGNVTVEAIAGYQMTYAGDPTKDDNSAYKLVDELRNGGYRSIWNDLRQRPEWFSKSDPAGCCP